MTSAQVACFSLYVGLWTAQTLLVRKAVQPNGSYPFDFATVCLLVELLKLVGAVGAVALGGDGDEASSPLARVRRLLDSAPDSLPFAVPSLLYTIYNLLQFINLALVPAPTFRTVINIKIVFTALFSACAFGARLRAVQWGALALLVFGCAVAQLDDHFELVSAGPFALICLQGSLSSVAAVYSQWLLNSKGSGSKGELGFWARSAWLYAWGALANLLFLRTRARCASLRERARRRQPDVRVRRSPLFARSPIRCCRSPFAVRRWHRSPVQAAGAREQRRVLRRLHATHVRHPRQLRARRPLDGVAASRALGGRQGVCKRR